MASRNLTAETYLSVHSRRQQDHIPNVGLLFSTVDLGPFSVSDTIQEIEQDASDTIDRMRKYYEGQLADMNRRYRQKILDLEGEFAAADHKSKKASAEMQKEIDRVQAQNLRLASLVNEAKQTAHELKSELTGLKFELAGLKPAAEAQEEKKRKLHRRVGEGIRELFGRAE